MMYVNDPLCLGRKSIRDLNKHNEKTNSRIFRAIHILVCWWNTKDYLDIEGLDEHRQYRNDRYDNILDLKINGLHIQEQTRKLKIPGKYPSASYSHVKFESTLIGWRVVVDFFFARQANAASVANKVTKFHKQSFTVQFQFSLFTSADIGYLIPSSQSLFTFDRIFPSTIFLNRIPCCSFSTHSCRIHSGSTYMIYSTILSIGKITIG